MKPPLGRCIRGRLGPCLVLAALLGATPSSAATYPPGFEERSLATGLDQPTAVTWAPDGRMFIAEKVGRVRVVAADGTLDPTPLLDISDRVESLPVDGHRGLLGLTVDTDFSTNNYLYLLYTHRPSHLPPGGPKSSRLTRVEIGEDNTVGPETVLLGTESNGQCPPAANDVDCIPSDGIHHSIGTVRSAGDGTLWVGTGDAAASPFRTYDEQSYAGKLLHVDREGRGLPGHPFCPLDEDLTPSDEDLTRVCTKLHAKGFRNPFRFTLRQDGRPAVGDVGENDVEELDLAAPGANYGWPCYEGTLHTPSFSGLTACHAEYAKEGTPEAATGPNYEYPHDRGGSIITGPTYDRDAFPSSFLGELFIGDYMQGFIRRLEIGPAGQVMGTQDYSYGWSGVDLELTPGGNLAYVDFGDGSPGSGAVREIRYVGRVPYAETVSASSAVRSYWRFGEASGTVAVDVLGASVGEYSGGVALGQPGALAGDADTAVGFDGVNDEVNLGGSGLALGGVGTVEGWFYWESGVTTMRDRTGGANAGWILAYDKGGLLAYRVGGTNFTTSRTTASVRGGWHHLALTGDGGRTAFYIDGELVHSGMGAGSVAARTSWKVMRNGTSSQYSRGRADEVAIYDRALSAATIGEHYRAGTGP